MPRYHSKRYIKGILTPACPGIKMSRRKISPFITIDDLRPDDGRRHRPIRTTPAVARAAPTRPAIDDSNLRSTNDIPPSKKEQPDHQCRSCPPVVRHHVPGHVLHMYFIDYCTKIDAVPSVPSTNDQITNEQCVTKICTKIEPDVLIVRSMYSCGDDVPECNTQLINATSSIQDQPTDVHAKRCRRSG